MWWAMGPNPIVPIFAATENNSDDMSPPTLLAPQRLGNITCSPLTTNLRHPAAKALDRIL